MHRPWQYSINQLLNGTKGNYRKALRLSNYHDAMLRKRMDDDPADPDWVTLYDRYHPIHTGYVAVYNTWLAAEGHSEGQTLNVSQLLKLLIQKVNNWDAQVQTVPGFEKGTPAHRTVFPDSHRPFYSGGRSMRIQAVETLAQAMLVHSALNAVRAQVEAFASQLAQAQSQKLGARGSTRNASVQVEAARIQLMTAQYRNLGFLMDKMAEQPAQIDPLFDLDTLRTGRQSVFTGTLAPGAKVTVFTRTLAQDDTLRLEATAQAEAAEGDSIILHLASVPNGTDSMGIQVAANAMALSVAPAQFGTVDLGTHRYLTAHNGSPVPLRYSVRLM